jgi:beta-lactamase regulating signal transducer with metallopeptidase domain
MQTYFDYHHFSSLMKASWQAAVLILLVLAVQWTFRRQLSPRWRYALWLLVIVRLALPWTVPSSASVFNILKLPSASNTISNLPKQTADPQRLATAQTRDSSVLAPLPSDANAESVATASPSRSFMIPWLLLLWFSGAICLTACLALTHYRTSRKIKLCRPLVDAPVLNLLEDCKELMGVRVPITLIEAPEVGSPALFGFVRPRLLLPAGLLQHFSQDELRHIFLHELGHIKRQDILTGWLMTALQIVHWFNPLVWLAFYRMRLDRELACDALALSYANERENQPYGRTMIKLLEGFGRSAWAPSLAGTVENQNQLKQRISMIAKFNKTNRGSALALLLFAALGLVTLTDAQPAPKSPTQKDLHGTWVLTGENGVVSEPPGAGARLKSFSGTNWSITQTDPKTGAVIFRHGGTFALNGDEYSETVEFANESTKELIGQTFKFKIKIEGDKLTLIGVGNPWNEVWKRSNKTGADTGNPATSPKIALTGITTDASGNKQAGLQTQAEATSSDQPQFDPEAPPRIVSTTPAIGANDVDPALTEITVTFDRDMQSGFSWTGGGPEHPNVPEGQKIYWRDARTCVYPVKLEAGHYYRVGINSKSYKNFRSVQGVPIGDSAMYFTTWGASADLKQKTLVPQIVSMSPPNGAQDVNAASTHELLVTFNVPMGGGFSWCGDGDNYPKGIEGQRPYWTNGGLTCVLPVELKPGMEYQLGINCDCCKNFQSAGGVPLEPINYTFKTAAR